MTMHTNLKVKRGPLLVMACALVATMLVSVTASAGTLARPTIAEPVAPPSDGPIKHTGQDSVAPDPGDGLDCSEDITGDSLVNVDDLVRVILDWGPCDAGACASDVNQSGDVNVDDLVLVLLAWGTCD